MTSADVVDQLVPEVPEGWLRWPTVFTELGHVSQLQTCAKGTTASVQVQIIYALVLTAIGRIATHTPNVGKPLLNPLLIFLGYLSLVQWVDNALVIRTALIGSILLAVFIKNFSSRFSGYGVTLTCLAYIVYMEHRLPVKTFASSRGFVMILAMKLSSLAFDVSKAAPSRRRTFDLPSMMSFLISPATITFGPFITYDAHVKGLLPKPWKQELRSAVTTFVLLVLSAVALVWSSCVIDLYYPPTLNEYGTAQSFRVSHYFVCFLAQALSQLSGVAVNTVNPHMIEMPRSLVQVVVAWNIPMHNYLKKYVFNETIRYGSAIALAATFGVSALFHGLNFQLSAVLLSLGFYCYAEHEFRTRLASKLDLPVGTRPRPRFRDRKKSNWLTFVINLIFMLINVYHLIYLGMVFDGSAGETGYSWQHTVAVWKRHHFASHIIAALTFVATFLPIF